MGFSSNIRAAVDRNRDNILSVLQKEAASKDYFKSLPMPFEQFMEVICNDYLETMVICYETGSMAIFREKLAWFQDMYKSRTQGIYAPGALSDFFVLLRKHVLAECGSDVDGMEKLLDDMAAVIKEYDQ